jgi:hypothetical protein
LGGLRRLWLKFDATPQEYLAWEDVMDHWLLPRSLDYGPITRYTAAVDRFDQITTAWWKRYKYDMHQKGQNSTCSWEELKSLLRQRFVPADCMVKQANPATTTIVPSADTKADVGKAVMKEAEPLSGLNMQLKRVHDETCITVDKGQRWNLFQAQCMIKGKACKFMIDSGSYCNGISKAIVEALGLSTWRIPEPRHVEWVHSCGMLKITHKVRVPFTVDDFVDEVECDVLPLEVCGLLLGRPWQYDHNAMHAGRANTYSFMHDGKQRTLKPMRDDQIKSDIVLVVRKEKLHKAKPKPGLAKVQPEEHDAKSVVRDIVSAKPVDDKPVVLVSDKPVEVKPLIDEGKDMLACVPCVPLPVHVDMGV